MREIHMILHQIGSGEGAVDTPGRIYLESGPSLDALRVAWRGDGSPSLGPAAGAIAPQRAGRALDRSAGMRAWP